MQQVVAISKDNERKAFAKRLNQAIGELSGAPREGRRASWLRREIERAAGRKVCSVEAARKWLSGETMPDQPHMAMVARLVKRSPTWLHTGEHTADSAGAGVRDQRIAYHGVLLTREGALLGQEWEKLPPAFRVVVQMQIECLVAAHARGELNGARPARIESPRAARRVRSPRLENDVG